MLPSHDIRITRYEALATVELWVAGARVSTTTMRRDIQKHDSSVTKFVHSYFHIPVPKEEAP